MSLRNRIKSRKDLIQDLGDAYGPLTDLSIEAIFKEGKQIKWQITQELKRIVATDLMSDIHL